jgi:hypothetical protein
MQNIVIIDRRGWDESDRFTLPIISAIGELEKEGFINEDIPWRQRTLGDASIALSEQLDYYSFDIVPRLNSLLERFRENPSNIRDNELLTQIARTFVDAIKTQNIIYDYLKRFLLEIEHYMGLHDFEDWDNLSNNEKEELLHRGKELLVKAQEGEDYRRYYRFINKYRNFAEHNGSLIPHEINGDEIIFLMRNSDPSSTISSKEILSEINKFREIRKKTLNKLKDSSFWKNILEESQN